MLTINQRIIDKVVFLNLDQVIFNNSLYVWIVYILNWGLNSFLRDVTSDKLYVNLMLLFHLLEIIKITFEFFILFPLVNGPILERQWGIEIANWLFQQHHNSLYEETTWTTEGVPKIQFARLICLLQDPTLKNARSSKRFLEYSPSDERFVTVFMQLFIRCPNQHLSPILDQVELNLAQLLETLLKLLRRLQLRSHLIQPLNLLLLRLPLLTTLDTLTFIPELFPCQLLNFSLFRSLLSLKPLFLEGFERFDARLQLFLFEIFSDLEVGQLLDQDVADKLGVEELGHVWLSTCLRHFKLHIFMLSSIRQVAMPWYFLQVSLQFLLSTSHKWLGNTHLNVFGNARLEHHVPESDLGALHLDDFATLDLFGLIDHRNFQCFQFLEKSLLQPGWRSYPISEHCLYGFFSVLSSGTCGWH